MLLVNLTDRQLLEKKTTTLWNFLKRTIFEIKEITDKEIYSIIKLIFLFLLYKYYILLFLYFYILYSYYLFNYYLFNY